MVPKRKQSVGTVAIYRRRKDGVYLVQPMCAHPTGGAGEIGDPTEIAESELNERLPNAVLEALRNYLITKWDPERGRRYDSRFLRSHDLVHVTAFSDGEIEVMPMSRVRSSYVSVLAQGLTFRTEQTCERIVPSIVEAFRIAAAG